MKVAKEFLNEAIKGNDTFYILTLFLGSTIILWVKFSNPNEMVASPRHGVKIYQLFSNRYVHYSVFLVVGCWMLVASKKFEICSWWGKSVWARVTLNSLAGRGVSRWPLVAHAWFNLISRTCVVGVLSYPSAEIQSVYSTFPVDWAAKLNSSKYCYLSPTVQLNISHLFTHSWKIKQFYFEQFSLACHLLALSLNVKVLFDP